MRRVGKVLGIAPHFLGRHPFPGPGLAVRCLGELKKERLDILREADAIFIEEIRKAGLYDSIWQAFCLHFSVNPDFENKYNRKFDVLLSCRNDARCANRFRVSVSTGELRHLHSPRINSPSMPVATISTSACSLRIGSFPHQDPKEVRINPSLINFRFNHCLQTVAKTGPTKVESSFSAT